MKSPSGVRARRPAAQVSQVPLHDVETELHRRLQAIQGLGEGAPVQRACMSNLVIFCDKPELADKVAEEVPTIVSQHPARVLLLTAAPEEAVENVTATVCVRGNVVDPGRWVVSEQVVLRAPGKAIERLPFSVRALLIGDLPVNLWWAASQPPPFFGALLFELIEPAQQIIYDSIGWPDPARGVVATAAWLEQVERGPHLNPPKKLGEGLGGGRWRVASDLNWRRLKYWRRLLSQALDPVTAPGALESITEVLVEHGPHAVIQAWELVSWLASRLKWQVKGGRVEPNVEISWQVKAAHGGLRVRIRRLAEGPSAVRRVRIACSLAGQPGALDFVVENERRLAVIPEGIPAEPRTVTAQPQQLADLVGRQLSDRERDPVFHESMAVAQVLAESVLGG